MSKEGNLRHIEFLQDYFKRKHVQEFLKEKDKTRRSAYGQIPVCGGVIIGLGALYDRAQMLGEAERDALYKEYI